MSNLFIVSSLVLAAGISAYHGRRPSWALQPATTDATRRRGVFQRWSISLAALTTGPDRDRGNPILESMRAIGLIRRRVPRAVVGKKAYVRWWQRLRAIAALGMIVLALGIALAAGIGIIILGAGFLLEQAIA